MIDPRFDLIPDGAGVWPVCLLCDWRGERDLSVRSALASVAAHLTVHGPAPQLADAR